MYFFNKNIATQGNLVICSYQIFFGSNPPFKLSLLLLYQTAKIGCALFRENSYYTIFKVFFDHENEHLKMGVNGGRSLQEVFVENFENLINQSKQKTKKKVSGVVLKCQNNNT